MTDWLSTMQQTFEYYIVDPGTWKDVKKIENVISSTVNYDEDSETLGSASIEVTESLDECYIRIYLITIQNGVREKHPLGTFLIQTPSYSFDGKILKITLDAYTPLLELKENPTPLGYSIEKNSNIMENAYLITRDNVRAPVVKPKNDKTLFYDFVANTDDTWISFIYDLIANANYTLGLDELGRIIFLPKQDIKTLQPVWTYDDSNSSILYPDLSIDRDLYGIPNVVEVIYSSGADNFCISVKNDDENSPISIPNRGREIIYRVTNPEMIGEPTEENLTNYAEQVLKAASSLEYTISYTHGYCPVKVGDCVRLNYEKAGLENIKAKVISQSIKCEPGCPVTEKAVFTDNLWEGLK